MAAALALFLLGAAAGAALWSRGPGNRVAAVETTRGAPVVVHPSSAAPLRVAGPAEVAVAPGGVEVQGASATPPGARAAGRR